MANLKLHELHAKKSAYISGSARNDAKPIGEKCSIKGRQRSAMRFEGEERWQKRTDTDFRGGENSVLPMSQGILMIREFKRSDMESVLDIWLKASIKAHSFIDREFWESKIDAMRRTYIPASDTYVFVENDTIRGFFSLQEDMLSAMFVSPDFQGQGIGKQLMNKAKSLRNKMVLTVYQENPRGIDFYRKCGFGTIEEKVDEHTGHIEVVMGYPS